MEDHEDPDEADQTRTEDGPSNDVLHLDEVVDAHGGVPFHVVLLNWCAQNAKSRAAVAARQWFWRVNVVRTQGIWP